MKTSREKKNEETEEGSSINQISQGDFVDTATNAEEGLHKDMQVTGGIDQEIIDNVEQEEPGDMPLDPDSGTNKVVTEENGMEENIEEVSKTGDLSPRHTDSLMSKGGKAKIPLQVKTRSSRSRTTSCDQ